MLLVLLVDKDFSLAMPVIIRWAVTGGSGSTCLSCMPPLALCLLLQVCAVLPAKGDWLAARPHGACMAAAAALTCLCIQLSCGAFRSANLRCNFAQSLIICPAYFLPRHCPLQGEFIDHVRTAGSPTQQLKLLNNYRPAELALTGASDEQWDAAVYTTLDRATLLKRLLRGGHASSGSFGGHGFGGSSASSPNGSSGPGSSTGGDAAAFSGPVVALLPRDRLGALMLEATRQQLQRPAGEQQGVLHLPLDTRHTECLLSEQGRQATAMLLTDAVRAVLPRL